MILFLVGCISQEIYFKQYDISLEVVNATSGAPHKATLLFEWFGQGELRYPMYPIEEVSFDGEVLENWESAVHFSQHPEEPKGTDITRELAVGTIVLVLGAIFIGKSVDKN